MTKTNKVSHDLEYLLEIARGVVHHEAENAAENPTESEILVVIVEPYKVPYKAIIPNDLETFKKIIGGYMEVLTLDYNTTGKKIALIFNEEGRLLNLPFNRRIANFDVLVGTFFITAYNYMGNNISLTEEDADYYIKLFFGTDVYI